MKDARYRTITFFQDGVDRILSGKKKATTRLGEDHFEQGETLALCNQQGEHFGYISINHKERRTFEQLDSALADIEGWPDAASFKQRLHEIYGDRVKNETLTVYHFNRLNP